MTCTELETRIARQGMRCEIDRDLNVDGSVFATFKEDGRVLCRVPFFYRMLDMANLPELLITEAFARLRAKRHN